MSKRERTALATYRKATMGARRQTYGDLARVARVSWSMADKWMNARRNSPKCERAFEMLTGRSPVQRAEQNGTDAADETSRRSLTTAAR